MRNIVWHSLSLQILHETSQNPPEKGPETPVTEGAKTEETPVETKDSPEKDEFYGSKEQLTAIDDGVKAGNIVLTECTKTQKTRGKGSRELSYKWNDVKFNNIDGVIAFVGMEERLLELLSSVASDMNQQTAWEALFELTDEDKLIRAAARKVAALMGVSEDEAIEQVKNMIASKKEAAKA